MQQLLTQVSCAAGARYMFEPTAGGLPSTALPVVAIPAKAGQVGPGDLLDAERGE